MEKTCMRNMKIVWSLIKNYIFTKTVKPCNGSGDSPMPGLANHPSRCFRSEGSCVSKNNCNIYQQNIQFLTLWPTIKWIKWVVSITTHKVIYSVKQLTLSPRFFLSFYQCFPTFFTLVPFRGFVLCSRTTYISYARWRRSKNFPTFHDVIIRYLTYARCNNKFYWTR